ncbi:MAG: MotA/TolQ/ExbB proton channel family protein [Candidatus Nitrospinota bacterium M3_3B_026]
MTERRFDRSSTAILAVAAALFLVFFYMVQSEGGFASRLWLVAVFRKGGVVMWPILLCSILALMIAMERAFSLRPGSVIARDFLDDVKLLASKGDFKRALKICSAYDSPLSRIVQAGLARGWFGILEVERAIEAAGAREAARLTARLRGLGVLANLTPMLGLLGTVIGMIKAFNVISESGTGNPGLVASGISEALITTATGLIVGIPSLAAYHFFRSKADRLIREMEDISLSFVEDIQHAVESAARAGREPVSSSHEI